MSYKRKARVREFAENQSDICYLCGGQMTHYLGKPNTMEREHIIPGSALKQLGIKKSLLANYNEAAAGSFCNAFKGSQPLHKVIASTIRMRLCESTSIEDRDARIRLERQYKYQR